LVAVSDKKTYWLRSWWVERSLDRKQFQLSLRKTLRLLNWEKECQLVLKLLAWRKNVWVSYYSALPRVRDFIWIRWLRGNYNLGVLTIIFSRNWYWQSKQKSYIPFVIAKTEQVVINRIRFTFKKEDMAKESMKAREVKREKRLQSMLRKEKLC
jgi:hypothetical protein